MNQVAVTGLGELEPIGKKSLFQPPKQMKADMPKPSRTPTRPERQPSGRRFRTTLDITGQSLSIIQSAQNEYKLRTGRSLPLWKIIDSAFELYAKSMKGESNAK